MDTIKNNYFLKASYGASKFRVFHNVTPMNRYDPHSLLYISGLTEMNHLLGARETV